MTSTRTLLPPPRTRCSSSKSPQATAAYDRQVKVPLYAQHGVPEVWIVDLDFSLVRYYRTPQADRYLDITATETPGPTPVLALPGVTIDLSGLL